jgi:dolichol kinase
MKTKTKIILQAFACFLCGLLAGMDLIQGKYLIMAFHSIWVLLFFYNISDYINNITNALTNQGIKI